MARKNPKVIELEEQLRKANLRADNEEELKHRAQGKLEKYEEAEEKEDRMVRDMRHREEEAMQRMMSDTQWMRRLVEILCVPADKLELLEKTREIVTMDGGRPYPRNY